MYSSVRIDKMTQPLPSTHRTRTDGDSWSGIFRFRPSHPYYRVRREHSAGRLLESWRCVPTPHHDRNPLTGHIVDRQEDRRRPRRVNSPARRRHERQRPLVLRDGRVHEDKPRADVEPMCGEPEVHERHFRTTPIPSRISNPPHLRKVPGWTYLGP